MEFEMNDRKFNILFKNQDEIFGSYKKENKQNGNSHLGIFNPSTSEIWLCENSKKEQIEKTLRHELMHCYIFSFISIEEKTYTEEELCDISSNASNIINKIVDKFNKVNITEIIINNCNENNKGFYIDPNIIINPV